MKVVEVRKMTTDELTKQSTELRDEIAQLKRQVALGELQSPRVIRNKRRDLARVLTVLSEHLSKETI